MKILVLGAAGHTGHEVVSLAQQKHTVTAFIQRKETDQNGIKHYVGDAMNAQDILQAVKDQDVIISTLGHGKNTPANMQATAMQNCLLAITELNQQTKLISLTGTGVRIDGDSPSLLDKILNFAIAKLDPKRIEDGQNHATTIMASKQPWVILRVLKLTNSAAKPHSLTLGGPARLFAPRKSVASCLVQLAETSDWDNQLPVFSRQVR